LGTSLIVDAAVVPQHRPVVIPREKIGEHPDFK
jgi:hypothetical protein